MMKFIISPNSSILIKIPYNSSIIISNGTDARKNTNILLRRSAFSVGFFFLFYLSAFVRNRITADFFFVSSL